MTVVMTSTTASAFVTLSTSTTSTSTSTSKKNLSVSDHNPSARSAERSRSSSSSNNDGGFLAEGFQWLKLTGSGSSSGGGSSSDDYDDDGDDDDDDDDDDELLMSSSSMDRRHGDHQPSYRYRQPQPQPQRQGQQRRRGRSSSSSGVRSYDGDAYTSGREFHDDDDDDGGGVHFQRSDSTPDFIDLQPMPQRRTRSRSSHRQRRSFRGSTSGSGSGSGGSDDNSSSHHGLGGLGRRATVSSGGSSNMESSSGSTHSITTTASSSPQYNLKNARNAVEGSVSAVINFLRTSGVPKPSTDELKRNVEMGRFFATLKRAQDYIRCVQTKDDDELLAMVHLSVTAWETLCEYKSIEYRRAYDHAFALRFEHNNHHQQQQQHHQQQQHQASPAEIKKAIDAQVTIAEETTMVQKNLYLVNRWKRYVLQKTNKASTIEPQGYQAIPTM